MNNHASLPNPLLPTNQDLCWVLLHCYNQPMDYPELAAHIPADPLIVELPELFSNRFLIWVRPLMDLTTINFLFNFHYTTIILFMWNCDCGMYDEEKGRKWS